MPAHRAALLAAPILLLAACSSSKSASEPPLTGPLHVASPAWEDQVVYFVLTDRFANGDRSNDDQRAGEFDPADGDKYSGGDLQGIIDRLDYIQGLGATAVWVTPPVANMWWDPLQRSGGYHGYWARDLTRVDEHLGTMRTYQRLAAELHRRGMYLIQDVVPNHMGNFFQYSSWDPSDVAAGVVMNTGAVPTPRPTQPPFDQDDPRDPAQRAAAIYHWTPAITDYLDPFQEQNFQVSDLDDLNTENPVVRRALKASYGAWIAEAGVDAFRVDTAKFVPHDFWKDFFHGTDPAEPGILAQAAATGRSDFLAFGEVFETSPAFDDAADVKVTSFLGPPDSPELPSVLQFPLYDEMKRVFAAGQPTADLAWRMARFMDPALWPNPLRTPIFLDNHDVERFRAVGSAPALAQALTFLFTIPGIPVVYQGTEQDMTETRAAMFQGGFHAATDRFDATSAGYRRVKALAALRAASPALRRGGYQPLYDSAAGPGALAFARTAGSERVLVLLNTADQPVLVAGLDTGLAPGAELRVLHAEQPPAATPTVGAGGLLTAILPARAALVLGPTGAAVTPPAAPITIAVTTAVEGQTFTDDVTIQGTVTGPQAASVTRVRLLVDDYVNSAVNVPVAPDGSFSVVLPVAGYPVGVSQHSLTFFHPETQVTSARLRFASDVTFVGVTLTVDDPRGDDTGPAGAAYTYPTDPTFGRQMDVVGVTAEVGVTTLYLKVTMAEWSTVWNPALGFDHVCFNVFFAFPGSVGVSFLPKLNATAPAGFGWSLDQFTYGWSNAMFTASGATETAYGSPTAAPKVTVDAPNRTVIFKYSRVPYGLASWSGVQVYLTTWDFDGIQAIFRPLDATAGPFTVGGGTTGCTGSPPAGCTDPKIMDDVGPFTLP